MKYLECLLSGSLYIQPAAGAPYCAEKVASFGPTAADYNSWWITIAVVVVGLFFMFVFFRLYEAQQVIDDADKEILDAAGEVILQGGRVVKAYVEEEQDKRNKEKHSRVERQIDVQLDEIIKRTT